MAETERKRDNKKKTALKRLQESRERRASGERLLKRGRNQENRERGKDHKVDLHIIIMHVALLIMVHSMILSNCDVFSCGAYLTLPSTLHCG